MVQRFRDRHDAGRRLASSILGLAVEHPVVLGLPRGGVPVAYEVALALDAPLDVIVVRKLGVPFQPELGMGAVGEDGVRVVDERMVRAAGVSPQELAAVAEREAAEVERRARRFRAGRPMVPLAGRTVVVVDDGLATGGTARAAIEVARARGARRVVLAVPVAPEVTAKAFADEVDAVVVLLQPRSFAAVGTFYADFSQTSDDDVVALLGAAHGTTSVGADDPTVDREVAIPAQSVVLGGHLTVPGDPVGLVVFAHGSGSSRHSPRNRSVARRLNAAGLGTLLFDLLTDEEAADRANVFDIRRLGQRLCVAARWLRTQPSCVPLRLGFYGASTGAAAALWAAAERDVDVAAIVSRGGRPDLAADRLDLVTAPTLLVVGGADDEVLRLNEQAARRLHCPHRVVVVPGATHLFEEPGALDLVSDLATRWFVERLAVSGDPAPRE